MTQTSPDFSTPEMTDVERIHVYPIHQGHWDSDINCWCNPFLEYKDPVNGSEVWVHRDMEA